MGVPRLFKWLVERYPLILRGAAAQPRPEFDNLYLDFNGVIHLCTHGTAANEGATEDEMISTIFAYLERIIAIVAPQSVLFIAVDGVAPRAKMNQQRQRRLRSALEAQKAQSFVALSGGLLAMPKKEASPVFDSNCITPGTDFMVRLNEALTAFVAQKMDTDVAWRDLNVIVSGHQTPGEGEHKIMDYVRRERAQPGYNPNTRHCLYGLDADLIMLALATHEPHFALLREAINFRMNRDRALNSTVDARPEVILGQCADDFQLLHIGLLREYLDMDMRSSIEYRRDDPELLASAARLEFDLERTLNDFVFLSFLIGNDFLPMLPTTDIDEGGLHNAFTIYRTVRESSGDYLVDTTDKRVNIAFMHRLLSTLADQEEEVVCKQLRIPMASKVLKKDGSEAEAKDTTEEKVAAGDADEELLDEGDIDAIAALATKKVKAPKKSAALMFTPSSLVPPKTQDLLLKNNKKAAAATAAAAAAAAAAATATTAPVATTAAAPAAAAEENKTVSTTTQETAGEVEEVAAVIDYKTAYYEKKRMSHDPREVCAAYTAGLQWVFEYYFFGLPSWSWYFPFHFAPLPSDLRDAFADCYRALPQWAPSEPLKPFQQLLAVLPAASSALLPTPLAALMTEATSPLAAGYSLEYETVPDHRGREWKDVALIPFFDIAQLVSVYDKTVASHPLSDAHAHLNQSQSARLFQRDPSGATHEFATPRDSNLFAAYGATIVSHCIACDLANSTYDAPRPDYVHELLPDCWTGLVPPPPAFPTTKSIAAQPEMSEEGTIRIFHRRPSRNTSLLLSMTGTEEETRKAAIAALTRDQSAGDKVLERDIRGAILGINQAKGAQVAHALLGGTCVSDYPFHCESSVVAVHLEQSVWRINRGGQVTKAPRDVDEWTRISRVVTERALHQHGIRIDPPHVIVEVRPIMGLCAFPNGGTEQVFEQESTYCAAQLLTLQAPRPIPQLLAREPPALAKRLPINSVAVYLGDDQYGVRATIRSFNASRGTFGVTLHVPANVTSTSSTMMQYSRGDFQSAQSAASTLSMNPLAMSRLFSAVTVRLPSDEPEGADIIVEVGLQLKYSRRQLYVPGYCRRVSTRNMHGEARTTWEYSNDALLMLQQLRTAFPDFIRAIEASPDTDTYDYTALLAPVVAAESTEGESAATDADAAAVVPEDEAETATAEMQKAARVRVEEILAFLRNLPSARLPLVPCDAKALGATTVHDLEEQAKERVACGVTSIERVGVLPNELLAPVSVPLSAGAGQTRQSVRLGSRVLNACATGPVVFGERGVVVAMRGNVAEVLWDTPLLGGHNLLGRCRTIRASTTPVSHLLSLDTPEFAVAIPRNRRTGVEGASGSDDGAASNKKKKKGKAKGGDKKKSVNMFELLGDGDE